MSDPNLELVLKVTDPLLSQYLESGKEALSEKQRWLLAVWLLDAEVNNGGFDQYFWNGSGDFTGEAIRGLSEFGARETASIVSAAAAEFPGPTPPENTGERRTLLDKIQNSPGARFETLDQQFYDCEEDLFQLSAAFIIREGMHAEPAA